jgi:hypothetical protein
MDHRNAFILATIQVRLTVFLNRNLRAVTSTGSNGFFRACAVRIFAYPGLPVLCFPKRYANKDLFYCRVLNNLGDKRGE